ncbi:large ribosomal subunit protein uL4-like [Oscarella lobularis]|uniref:large ribosomal subunit protein uL4-like n=1 Tax=Oscarella lobularis TaxID=121494 RepID=UPI003313C88A
MNFLRCGIRLLNGGGEAFSSAFRLSSRRFFSAVIAPQQNVQISHTEISPPIEIYVEKLTSDEKEGPVFLDSFVFGAPPRLDILNRVVLWQRAKRRAGLAKTKNRGEVRGGGRKPWRQKGSGRARQGSIRAPHWRKGGVVHGPVPRSYEYTLPKQVKRMGLRVALSVRLAQNDFHLVDTLQLESHKTKDLLELLEKKGWTNALFVDEEKFERNFQLASSNIEDVDILPTQGLNVYSILLRDKIILSLNAAKTMTSRLQCL